MRLLRTSWPRVLQKSPISILCRCHKVETNNGYGISFPVKEQRTYKEWRSWKLYKMKSRGMIRLKGPDVLPFLQGLVTNDVFQMMGEVESMYTMMLNSQVRCMGHLRWILFKFCIICILSLQSDKKNSAVQLCCKGKKLVLNNQMITVQSIYEIICTSAIFSFI